MCIVHRFSSPQEIAFIDVISSEVVVDIGTLRTSTEQDAEAAESLRMRLCLELEDVLRPWLESALVEVASLRHDSLPARQAGAPSSISGSGGLTSHTSGIGNMVRSLTCNEEGITGKHKVVKSSLSANAKKVPLLSF